MFPFSVQAKQPLHIFLHIYLLSTRKFEQNNPSYHRNRLSVQYHLKLVCLFEYYFVIWPFLKHLYPSSQTFCRVRILEMWLYLGGYSQNDSDCFIWSEFLEELKIELTRRFGLLENILKFKKMEIKLQLQVRKLSINFHE
jgi:hypothetical protein